MKIIWFIFLLICYDVCVAKNQAEKALIELAALAERCDNYVGVYAGLHTIHSMSFRRGFKDFDIQFSILPDYASEAYPSIVTDTILYQIHNSNTIHARIDDLPLKINGYSTFASGTVGTQIIKGFNDNKYSRIVGSAGLAYAFSYEKYEYEELYPSYRYSYYSNRVYQLAKGEKFYNTLKISIEVGGDLFLWRFLINIMGGFCGVVDLGNHKITANPTLDIGIFYGL